MLKRRCSSDIKEQISLVAEKGKSASWDKPKRGAKSDNDIPQACKDYDSDLRQLITFNSWLSRTDIEGGRGQKILQMPTSNDPAKPNADVNRRESVHVRNATKTCDVGLCHHAFCNEDVLKCKNSRTKTISELKCSYRDLAKVMKEKASWDKEVQYVGSKAKTKTMFSTSKEQAPRAQRRCSIPSIVLHNANGEEEELLQVFDQPRQGIPMHSTIRVLKRNPSVMLREHLNALKINQTMVEKIKTDQIRRMSLNNNGLILDLEDEQDDVSKSISH